MSDLTACAFCGKQLPTAQMDMTGHGWRCAPCGSVIIIIFTGAMAGGLGMLGHGVHRKRHAQAALSRAPDARVVTK
jgi:hypothetical protein